MLEPPRSALARQGFTLVEILLVMMLAGVLAAVVVPAMGSAQRRMNIGNSQKAAISLAARARALAMDRGTLTALEFDAGNDRAWILLGEDTVTNSRVDFSGDFGTTLEIPGVPGILTICYSSKGYALFSCSSGALPVALRFAQGSQTGVVTVRPLGQIEKAP